MKRGLVIGAVEISFIIFVLWRLTETLKPEAFEHVITAVLRSLLAAGGVFWIAKSLKKGNGACLFAASISLPILWALMVGYIAIRSI